MKQDVSEHLKSRHMDVDLYSGIMIFDDVAIFPLWNLTGVYCGYQQYRPNASKERKNDPRDGRYYTSLHGDKNEKPLAMWGLESYHMDSRYLVIVEGVFDAVRLHNHGIPAIATLTSNTKHLRNWLTCTGRKIFKVDDDHGSNLGRYENINLPDGVKDLGDCSEENINNIVKHINKRMAS